jgi:hypothetical protein
MERRWSARPRQRQGNFRPCFPAQPALHQLREIAPAGGLAIDMGDYITVPDTGQVGRAAGHQLADDDLAVRGRNAVDADTTEIGGGVPGLAGTCRHEEK